MKLDLKKIELWSALLFSALTFTACLNNDDDQPIVPQDISNVIFLNASPDSNGLFFYSNNRILNTTAANYSQLFGIGLESGNNKITIKTNTSSELDSLSINFEKNKFYSVFAVNKFDNIELKVYQDALFTPAADKAIMRFIQLSPDAPEMIVSIEGQEEIVGIFNYLDVISYRETDPVSNKKINLINAETQEVLFSKEITLTRGNAYSIFSKGLINTPTESRKLNIDIVTTNL